MHGHGFLSAAFVASLALTGFAQTNVTLTLQVSGVKRSCVVHVPSGAEKPPLVFFVHGATGSGAGFRNDTKGDVTADREKFIAAYPSASSDGGSGIWDDMQGTGNFPFFQAVIDTLDARYKIDRNRIYMTGFSQGGFISFAAACFYSEVFAAVAPVSGHTMTSCTLKRPVPMFMTFGGNEGAASFLKDLDYWLKLNTCPPASTIARPYPASNPNSKVTRVSYASCSQGTSVLMDSISGQGHQWPGANNLNQADEAWAFFKQYSLSSATGTRPEGLGGGREAISVSYAAGMIRLNGIGDYSRVQVSDTKGRLIATAAGKRNQIVFADVPRGLYVVTVRGSGKLVSRKILVP